MTSPNQIPNYTESDPGLISRVAQNVWRIITLRSFVPEQPLASHGDHTFGHPTETLAA